MRRLAATERTFCGREEQLETLLSCWQEVRSGLAGPRTVVLLAEAGLGKTRLAQQFYDRLVALEQNDAGYWPPRLGVDGNNLLVNPPAASWDAAADMPFLWWGVRLPDPVGHNQVTTGALAAHVDGFLVPHLTAFHREQRRRQRLLQLAKVGGAVAADAILDLVPFLGLLKKVGEVGLELKGIHDSWRQDRRTLDAATLLEERRDSLVDQLIADLDKLFTGPAGRRVPAVILVDDAQFSASDAGVTAFLAALVPAMTAGRWPVLLLLTHWEREYVDGIESGAPAGLDDGGSRAGGYDPMGASPVAAIIDEHSRQELDSVKVIRLAPIAGLEPLVTSQLPGLTSDQVGQLTERAGGNPRFLDEIVRVALDPRNRALFEGRNTTNAMTDAGVTALLAKSVRLHDVVAERFSGSPEAVQKAVALAGLQGAQFLRALVGDAEVSLGEAAASSAAAEKIDVEGALAAAEHRHAFVASLGWEQAAFSQRIYQEVAREFLPAFYDEDEAVAALRRAVSDVVTGTRLLDLSRDAATQLWRLGVTLFEESQDVDERRIAAYCLHMLSQALKESGELQVAYVAALRQAALLDTLPDGRLDGDLAWLRAVNDTLAAVGDLDAQRDVLTRLVRLTGETYDDDVNTWSASMYAQALLDMADFYELIGERRSRADALSMAVDALASLEGHDEDIDSLETSLRLHRVHGEWFVEAGELERAVEVQDRAHAIATHLAAIDDGPGRRFDLAVVQRQVGRSALLRRDYQAAAADLEAAVANLRDLLGYDTTVTLEIQLASTLDDLAEAYDNEGRLAEAEALLLESLALMRRHLSMAPEASRTRYNLADSLERVAQVRRSRGSLDSAWDVSREAVELRRAVVDQLGTSAASADLGFSLARAAEVAGKRAAFGEGYGHAREALELLRGVHERDDSARSVWRLLFAIKVALPFEMSRAGLAAARALLHEADTVYAGLPAEARGTAGPLMSHIETLRALVLESDGDLLGASQARARASSLDGVAAGTGLPPGAVAPAGSSLPAVGEDDHGPN